MSISKDGGEVERWRQIVEKMAKPEEAEIETPEEEAAEDAKMKKGTKKASEKDVVEFLKGHKNPDDDAVHDWAEEQGFEIHGLEKLFYKLASDHVAEMGDDGETGEE
jgi:hypothetical protein